MAEFFFSKLNGTNVVPPVATLASGLAFLGTDDSLTMITFIISVNDLNQYTSAQLRLGLPGSNGPVVATLFETCRRSISVGPGTVFGTITREDLLGPLSGRSIEVFVRRMALESVYINVTSERFPKGEIRGQVISPFER
ncbi:CHRD domain-containing protein [Bacillus cereus]|uniref:CHRD domain-containing protein n=1 Tax=Bacillus cereus TaxID=1396 RepID=UPI0005CE775F|nr:CHRD domain-containing protein [Bacillus cereus]